jgi:hypothetical protein
MQDLGESYELWGTFSVMDHRKRGAFLSEVILYDKLVIPVPPDPAEAGSPKEHEFASKQWDRWVEAGWQPERQQELLKILSPVVEPVAWDFQHHVEWQIQFDEWLSRSPAARANRLGELMAGWGTGDLLLKELPAKAAGAVAVCPFDSIDELKKQIGITEQSSLRSRREASDDLPGDLVSTVVGREFLVPSDPERDEFYLLKEAVDLVQDVNYREQRRAFHGAQLQFMASGHTDFDSVKGAVDAMDESLEALIQITKKRRFRSASRHGFFFMQAAADFVPGGGTVVKGLDAAISVGRYTASDVLQNPTNPQHNGIAGALLVDAQRQLDLTLQGERSSRRLKDFRRWRRRRQRQKSR